jgi:hypothetical protein
MRKLRFRSWDVERGEWMSEFNVAANLSNQVRGVLPPEVAEKYPIMQWTGLTDRSGKEIYEGDILDEKSNSPFKVVWRDGDCGFCADFGDTLDYNLHDLARFFEVVGNIYENPDLLAGEIE